MQGLQTTGVVVGIEEELQVMPEFVMAAVVVAADRGVLEGTVHPLDLTVRPRVRWFGGAMVNAMLLAGMGEGVDEPDAWLPAGGPVSLCGGLGFLVDGCAVDELRAVVGEHSVDAIGHGRDQGMQEVGGDPAGCPLLQLGEGEL